MGLLKDDHVYSYSQLTSFAECPYSFYMQRIEGVDQKSNAFAEQGSLIHELIDEWAKGKLTRDQLPVEYEKRYASFVQSAWPKILASKGYAEKTYEQGLIYFEDFNGFEGYEILDTEQQFRMELCGRPFVGIIDMIMRDEFTGDLIILDHKSKSSDSFRKAADEMYRQQYIYSKHVYEQYGQWPDILMFNLFKENGLLKQRPFEKEIYDETIRWAGDIMDKIESYDFMDWTQTKERQDFYCLELCNVRGSCFNGVYVPRKKAK